MHIFAIPQKRTLIFQVILFRGNVLTNYRKRECFEIHWSLLDNAKLWIKLATSKQWFRKKWLKWLQCRIISAFQNCSRLVNRTHFGFWATLVYFSDQLSPVSFSTINSIWSWFSFALGEFIHQQIPSMVESEFCTFPWVSALMLFHGSM